MGTLAYELGRVVCWAIGGLMTGCESPPSVVSIGYAAGAAVLLGFGVVLFLRR
jgi:hypothetical protein